MSDHQQHASSPEPGPEAGAGDVVEPVRLETEVDDETVTVRRSPRYGAFMIAGFVLAAVVAVILTFAFPENDEFDRGQVFGFLLLGLGAIGVTFGAVIALALDRAFSRRPGRAIVEHESTHRADD